MMDSYNPTHPYRPIIIPHTRIGPRATARRPHTGRTSIRDVIVMIKRRHHVASQRIQEFLEAFFMFFQYQMRYLVVSKKNPYITITVCHHLASLVMPITDPRGYCSIPPSRP